MRFNEFKLYEAAKFIIDVPHGRQGPEVADVQKVLRALGFDLGPHGVDGIRGPDTSSAVKQFQQEAGITVDGDPGVDTVSALNKILASNPEVASKLVKSTAADVKAQPSSSVASQRPLATDAVTTGKVGKVLDFIARYESGGNYNILQGSSTAQLTNMTIAQVFDLQRQMLAKGHESSAVGRYQYVGPTLREMVQAMGLDTNKAKFDEKTQDAIAIADMRRRCGLDAWLNGSLPDETFLAGLSKVWAGLPNPKTGGSTYAGVGTNKAGTSTDVALNTLNDIKTTTA